MVTTDQLQDNNGQLPDISELDEVEPVAALSATELDQAVAIAHRYPRSITKFMRDALTMATADEETAKECIYALRRTEWDKETRKEVVKIIDGPSIRLAEIMINAWGNVKAGSRIIEEAEEYVVSQGVFIDLQKNVHISRETRRNIMTTGKQGQKPRRYSREMITTTANAASSIALRNSVTTGIPRALWKPILNSVKKVIAGDVKTIAARRESALKALNVMGIANDRIFAVLGVEGPMDVGQNEIVVLAGMYTAIKDEEITAEEAFPPIVRKRELDQPQQEPVQQRQPDPKPQPTVNEATRYERASSEAAAETEAARSLDAEKKAKEHLGNIQAELTKDAQARGLLDTAPAPAKKTIDEEYAVDPAPSREGAVTFGEITQSIAKAKDLDALEAIRPMIDEIPAAGHRKSLTEMLNIKVASVKRQQQQSNAIE